MDLGGTLGRMGPAVFLPAIFVVIRTNRLFFAVTDGIQLIGRKTQPNQELLSILSATVTQG